MNATIEQVELLGPDGEDSVVLYTDEPQTVDLLSVSDILVPRQVQVDGVANSAASEYTHNAALVVVDMESDDGGFEESGQFTCMVLSDGSNSFVLTPSSDSVCGFSNLMSTGLLSSG
jgi:hypothetical protein